VQPARQDHPEDLGQPVREPAAADASGGEKTRTKKKKSGIPGSREDAERHEKKKNGRGEVDI
jgi:hypothetical protein